MEAPSISTVEIRMIAGIREKQIFSGICMRLKSRFFFVYLDKPKTDNSNGIQIHLTILFSRGKYHVSSIDQPRK